MKIKMIPLIILTGIALLAAACASTTPTPTEVIEPVGLPNPASQNCLDQGGDLVMMQRGDGGQYGVCFFEDNRQCEEWALMRGDCPLGGLKVTGYITEAAVYCAITGGTYTITGTDAAGVEQGTCTLPDGTTTCDVWEYYNGLCPATE
jgi:putative hemolysin